MRRNRNSQPIFMFFSFDLRFRNQVPTIEEGDETKEETRRSSFLSSLPMLPPMDFSDVERGDGPLSA